MPDEVSTKIIDVIKQGGDVVSLRLKNVSDVPFKPGQFMSFSFDGSKDLTRWLSISSSPTEKEYIECTKKITDSGFSKRFAGSGRGDSVIIKYPFGKFIFDGQFDKVVFLSGGVGITPIKSMLRYISDKALGTDAVLLYGNHSVNEITFKSEIDGFEKTCRNFKAVYTICEDVPGWEGYTGYITEEMIRKELPDFKDRIFYTCGPPGMVQGIKDILKKKLAIQDEAIIYENFAGY